eukprot:s91_g21.t2
MAGIAIFQPPSPLHLSARPKYAALALANLLVDAAPDVPSVNGRGETPLHAMALRGRTTVVRGWTALSAAAARGHRATAEVLLDAAQCDGTSPMALAAKAGHAEMVQFLQLKDLHQEPLEGYSPLEWATRSGHHAVMELLSAETDARVCDAEHCVSRPSPDSQQIPMFSRSPFFLKNLKSVLKWWALLFHAHPLAFAAANVNAVLHCSVEVLRTLTGLNVSMEMRPWLEGLLRSQLLMLSHSFNTVTFRKGPQPNHQGAALEAARLCHSQFGDFLRAHSVADLCELACRAALRLPQEEVQTWLSEPEDQLLGPQCQTELHQAGEACIKALGQTPLDQPLVEHIAKRMQEETASAPNPNDSFDVVIRKDMLLSLLAFCHSQLTPHLQFQVMLSFILPIAQLVPHLQPQAPAVLLPVRLCSVLRTWAADIPSDALMPVLQLLQAFLSAESPKAVRLAALSPLRVMLERFSDHEAWTQVQGQLIDSSLALLSIVTSPEVQWRCLNLVNLFLVEEAESGRYQVTERTMQQLLELWRRPEEGEFLIRHALLDVLRALVLMSCRSRSPRLALSPPLLSCCLTVISDCYAVHRGGTSSGSKGGYSEAGAALQADAEAAAGALGDQGSASGSLFDSGSVLFLGVLRTVDIQQAVPLMPFFPQLLQQQASLPGPPAEWTMDILLEYCALHCSGGAAGHLLQFYPALLKICQSQLSSEAKATRSTEMSLQLLQLLLAHAPNVEALQQTKEVIVPLFQSWVTTFDPWATKSNFALPITTFLGLLGAWHACHPNDFTEHCLRFTEQAASCGLQVPKLSVLLAACCKQARSVALRSSVMSAALALAPNGVEEAFWREIMNGCNELILAANKRGISSALAKTLQSLKSSLSAKLPAPAEKEFATDYIDVLSLL